MFRSIEHCTFLGEPIKPRKIIKQENLTHSSLILGLATNTSVIPFEVRFSSFQLGKTHASGASTLQVNTYLTRLRDTISAEDAESFRGLVLSVKLPNKEWLTSYPNLMGLYGFRGMSSIRFSFFEVPYGDNFKILSTDSFRRNASFRHSLRNYLPALIVPQEREALFAEDQDRGTLAFKTDHAYQEGIEIKFDLLDAYQIPTVQYSCEDIIPITGSMPRLWIEKDWSNELGNLSTQTLTSVYARLLSQIQRKRATAQEIDYIRDTFNDASNPDIITGNLFMFQFSQAKWIKMELKRRLSGRPTPVI